MSHPHPSTSPLPGDIEEGKQSTPANTLYAPDGSKATPSNEKGGPDSDGPEQGELTIGAQQGSVFIKLPSGKVMGISPKQAKSLGGDLLNFAREARSQQKKLERQKRVAEKKLEEEAA